MTPQRNQPSNARIAKQQAKAAKREKREKKEKKERESKIWVMGSVCDWCATPPLKKGSTTALSGVAAHCITSVMVD